MARIKEFRGLRPGKDMCASVAELPYDVLTDAEIRAIAEKRIYSFYHITRPEVDYTCEVNPYSDIVYQKGRDNLSKFIKKGILLYDETESLYLYTLILHGRTQTGLVVCVHIDDYEKNIIKKNELTLDSKVEDRKRHIEVLKANTGLVFLFYIENGTKRTLFEKAMSEIPVYDFISDDGIRHVLRVISDREIINNFKEAFSSVILYVADGHHRAHSAYKAGVEIRGRNKDHTGDEEYNWLLAVIFPHNELKIMAYNRLVSDLGGLSTDAFFNEIKKRYIVEKDDPIIERNSFRMFIDKWYKLIPKFRIPEDPVERLDVQILQNTILGPILDIKNPKSDNRLEFIPGTRSDAEIENLVKSGMYRIAFLLMPISIQDLIRVSDEGKLMPPKSTWFEPKLRSGLVIHML